MTVFNRSNDLHWGIFGANLCQFSTIQELMLSWLKGSGQEEYANLEMGTYHQVTDSMHIYLDSYGSDISDKVEKYYEENAYPRKEADFTCANEPRMSMNQKQFYNFMDEYWNTLDKHVSNDENVKNNSGFEAELSNLREQGKTDNYWEFAARAMYLYRCLRLGNYEMMTSTLDKLQPCQWKISLMYFMKNFVNKIENEEQAKLVRDNFEKNKQQLKENLLDKEYEKDLDAYLALA
jgi:hypothetical protein